MTTMNWAKRRLGPVTVLTLAACLALVLFIAFVLRPMPRPEDSLSATFVKDQRMVLLSRDPVDGWRCELLVYRDIRTDQTLYLAVCSGVGSATLTVSK